ncbi:MAG: hypothetical protein ACTHU0_09075 [Kofleriaceae bacterium]
MAAATGRSEEVAARDASDPVDALAPSDRVAWLVPGPVQLELGGASIDGLGGNRPLAVGLIARRGQLAQVAVRLDHARFAAWTDRARLLATVARDEHVAAAPGGSPGQARPDGPRVVLRPGARVRRLAREDAWTRVRYVGAVEIEGWIPEASLAETGAARDPIGRLASGRRTLSVLPGSVIRSEPRWGARPLATMANGFFLDLVRELDPAWVEVAYADGEVELRGFVSRREPPSPSPVHRTRDPETTPPPVHPTARVASGTCLYARRGGEAVGYVVGDRDVSLEPTEDVWWELSIDSPWGPIAFAARGRSRDALVRCAPPGSVPPSTLSGP